jgi:putative RNA 2'-phosphotransferase
MRKGDPIKRASKFLRRVLENPGSLGIVLDRNGWGSVDVILRTCIWMKRPMLLAAVHQGSEWVVLSDDGEMIRAQEEAPEDPALDPLTPPARLFHGTHQRAVQPILNSGLQKRQRRYVHLSEEREAAENAGRQQGVPVLFGVDSGAMHRDGHIFFRHDGVWLTDHVPMKYLALPR